MLSKVQSELLRLRDFDQMRREREDQYRQRFEQEQVSLPLPLSLSLSSKKIIRVTHVLSLVRVCVGYIHIHTYILTYSHYGYTQHTYKQERMAEAVQLEEALRNLLKDTDQRMGRWYSEYYAPQPYQVSLSSSRSLSLLLARALSLSLARATLCM